MSAAPDTTSGTPPVEVRRSRRRTRTVSAYRRDGRVVARFAPDTAPDDPALIGAIETALDQPAG